MDQTTHLNLPIPNPDAAPPTNISDEFPRIALAFVMLDLIIHTLQGVVAGKAESEHEQAISTITGLTEALAGKMAANATFSLDDLQDVQGAAAAAVNYVLVKNSEGQWVPSSALAAIGVHEHSMAQVVGLLDQLLEILDDIELLGTSKADATATATALGSKADKATTVTGGGLVSGGGPLDANRVLTVTAATNAQGIVGTATNVAMTPASTKAVLDASVALPRNIVVFTSSGTYTKPAGLKAAKVTTIGGGGGTGGNGATATADTAGGGGGGTAQSILAAADIASSVSVTIGAGGTAGTSSPSAGGKGGTSSFGSLVVATGGDGSPAGNATSDTTTPAGGVGTAGQMLLTGGRGGRRGNGNAFGGAAALFGVITPAAPTSGLAGAANSGAGASGRTAGTNLAGSIGGSGFVIIEEYY